MRRTTGMACLSASVVACVLAATDGASARNMEMLQQLASGVEGYYQSRDRCYYHPSIDPVIEKADAFLGQQYGNIWETMRERVAPGVQGAVNMRRTFEPDAPPGDQALCQIVSIFVAYVLASSLSLTGPVPEVLEEMSRLSGGDGRVK